MKADNKQTKVIVPLNLVLDAIRMADDERNRYLDIATMEVSSLPPGFLLTEYDEADQELVDMIKKRRRGKYFRLPTQFEIDVYGIIEGFIRDLSESRIQDSLENAIRGRGRGGLCRFQDAVRRLGIEQQWYDFQEGKHHEIAVKWCEDHGFGYSVNNTQNKKEETVNMEDSGDRENLTWQEVSTEHIVQDEWIDFRRTAYRLPDGSIHEPFYNYSRRDYVVIVASDKDGKYLCVRQFRQGIREVTTEFPAGGIERSDGREYGTDRDISAENALEAAKRELLEETGYVSYDWEHLITVLSNATISDNYAYIFEAKNCRKSSGQHLDETEFLNVRRYSAAELEELIQKGAFPQAVHIMAWLLAQRK